MTNSTNSSPENPEGDPEKKVSLLTRILNNPKAPFYIGGLIAVGVLAFAASQALPIKNISFSGAPRIVAFDPVKFLNAQRAAASILAVRPSADLALTMTQVAKQSEAVILEEANGAIVVVKQALVVPDSVEDITDSVLRRFGLSTEVPTVSTDFTPRSDEILDLDLTSIAPSNTSISKEREAEDRRLQYEIQAGQYEKGIEVISDQMNLIP